MAKKSRSDTLASRQPRKLNIPFTEIELPSLFSPHKESIA
jgi:hypothetical protein